MSSKFTEYSLKNALQLRIAKLMGRMTQSQLAKDTGISRQNLAKYLTGKAVPNSYTLCLLAEYFGVSCDYLLGLDDGKTIKTEEIMKRTGLTEDALMMLEDYNQRDEFKIETFAINSLLKYSEETSFLIALGKYISAPSLEETDLDGIYSMMLPHFMGINVPYIDTTNNDGVVYYENLKLDDIVYHQMVHEFNNIVDLMKKDHKTKEIFIEHIIKILKPYYRDEVWSLYEYEHEYGEKVLENMKVDEKVLQDIMENYLEEKEKRDLEHQQQLKEKFGDWEEFLNSDSEKHQDDDITESE